MKNVRIDMIKWFAHKGDRGRTMTVGELIVLT